MLKDTQQNKHCATWEQQRRRLKLKGHKVIVR